MNKLILCLLFSVTALAASSQKVYFVYIQTESDQPFFIKMNEKVSSSSGSGYIILSKLHDSTYNFSIGFPQNKYSEQNFSIVIAQKDHGYLLKNFGDKGWGLFDLQTLTVQMSSSKIAGNNGGAKTDNKDVSAFTDILSKAADDPSLKDKPVQKIEEKKIEPAPQEALKKEEPKAEVLSVVKTPDAKVAVAEPVITKPVETIATDVIKKDEPKTEPKLVVAQTDTTKKEAPKEIITIKPLDKTSITEIKKDDVKGEIKDTIIAKPAETIVTPVVKEEIKIAESEEYKKSLVTKKSESSTTEGFGLVFFDDYQNGTKDTIRLIIPNPKPAVVALKEEPKEEKKFLDIATDVKKEDTATTNNLIKKEEIKNTCVAVADGTDFQKLRKNMAAKTTDDEMVNEAAKFFKTKCFTVHQLENLQTLFLNDAGKYKFFDAAYNFASDVENFSSLQSALKDEYYITRFKAMLRN